VTTGDQISCCEGGKQQDGHALTSADVSSFTRRRLLCVAVCPSLDCHNKTRPTSWAPAHSSAVAQLAIISHDTMPISWLLCGTQAAAACCGVVTYPGICSSYWIRLPQEMRPEKPRARINWLYIHGQPWCSVCLQQQQYCIGCRNKSTFTHPQQALGKRSTATVLP
jgi:hypothetical protein